MHAHIGHTQAAVCMWASTVARVCVCMQTKLAMDNIARPRIHNGSTLKGCVHDGQTLKGRVLHTLEDLKLISWADHILKNTSLHCTSFLYMNSNIWPHKAQYAVSELQKNMLHVFV